MVPLRESDRRRLLPGRQLRQGDVDKTGEGVGLDVIVSDVNSEPVAVPFDVIRHPHSYVASSMANLVWFLKVCREMGISGHSYGLNTKEPFAKFVRVSNTG